MTQTQQVQPNYLAHRASLLNPNWKYIPAAQTDIMKRFRAMGWVPPSEKKMLRKLCEFLLLCLVAGVMALIVLEWFAGCGESYIDSKGVSHKHECLFLDLHK